MAVNPSAFGPKPQFMTATGAPAAGYKLFFYVSPSVGTKQNTYTDYTGVTPNTNPIVLNTLGEPSTEIWFTAGQTYTAVLAPPTDTDPPTSPIWTIPGLKGQNDATVTVDQWITGPAPTFVSGTSFTLAGDQTSTFQVNRRLKIVDAVTTKYATISASSYDGVSLTTITVVNDGAALSSPLSAVSYGILSATNPSIPTIITGGVGVSVAYAAGVPTITNQLVRGYIAGLTLSTAGSSASMSIAAGVATSSDQMAVMNLASSITKTTSAWAVGTGQGGKAETGAVANNTKYYFYEIYRPDTGVVDVCFSTVATGLPAAAFVAGGGNVANAYTRWRYIGMGLTNGSAQWTSFSQFGDEFLWATNILDINTSVGTTAALSVLTVPIGIKTQAIVEAHHNSATSGATLWISSPDQSDQAVLNNTTFNAGGVFTGATLVNIQAARMIIRTNTSGQIRYVSSAAATNISIATVGYIDYRGRFD